MIRREQKNYVEIHPTQWGQLNGDDDITFQNKNGKVLGYANVQLLCEFAENAEVIDFSQGVRHYYRNANGVYYSDANGTHYFCGY
ncbi:hypothetical protein niasHS_004455 [Heterodera schachtii]|uniref:WG repeat-containing protein n=1 Tax=Heterodera schachtii TaxID=97005 RepID=A0ABD2JR17_HETSC